MAHDPKNPRSRSPEVTAATSDHIDGSRSGSGSRQRVPTHTFNPGDTIAGRYRIVSILGTGGMGEVYRADDLTLGASVALKFLPADLATDPVRLDRFRGEVRLTRQISHANVCRVYDIVEADGRVFLTMEYIDGEDLSSLLRRIGRLPQDKAVEVARQICAGLQAAHDQGVIHRDLKPSNVMVDGRGRARIMDFGIAAIGDVRGDSAIAGTPVYMAPEQLAGREATAKSDLYALGLVLHEVFTGRRVHDVETLADLREIHKTSSRPSSLSQYVADIDPAIERAVHRCLESDPADRPSSAISVSASLPGGDPLAAALAAGETPSPQLVAAAGSRGGIRPAVAMALIATFVALAVAFVAMTARTDMVAAVDPALPRAVLEQKAREMLVEFEGEHPSTAHASGWTVINGMVQWIKHGPLPKGADPTARWEGLGKRWAGPVAFWYRATDGPFAPRGAMFEVSEDNPPRVGTDQRFVQLDPHGRLQWLEISPSERHRPVEPIEHPMPEAHFSRAFALAGLERAAFRPSDNRMFNRLELDAYRSWVGPCPDNPEVEIGVHAGVRDGGLRWFRVEFPFDMETPAPASAPAEGAESSPAQGATGSDAAPEPAEPTGAERDAAAKQSLEWFTLGVAWVVVVGSVIIAWRNVRARRSDLRGAVRAALVIFVVFAVGTLIMRDSVPGFATIFIGENPIIGTAVINAAYFLVFYIALEPIARKVWPSLLVSWIRLTSGRWRDPMVGRDVLIGMVGGAGLLVLTRVAMVAPIAFGITPNEPVWGGETALLGPVHVLGSSLWCIAFGMITASFFTLGLVLLRVIVRSKIAAMVVMMVLFCGLSALGGAEVHWSVALIAGLAAFLQIMLLLRYGFLALTSAVTVATLMAVTPLGVSSHSWWAGTAVIPALLIAGLAAYGYITAVGNQPGAGARRMPG